MPLRAGTAAGTLPIPPVATSNAARPDGEFRPSFGWLSGDEKPLPPAALLRTVAEERRPIAKPDTAAAAARRFCHALAEETAGMTPGSWRMVHTIAQRMGITFDEASSIADNCVRRGWADHRQHTVSLREEGRQVAVAVLPEQKHSK